MKGGEVSKETQRQAERTRSVGDAVEMRTNRRSRETQK